MEYRCATIEDIKGVAELQKKYHVSSVSEEDKKAIEDAVNEAKKHQNSTDKDELEKAAKDLQDAIMPIGAKLYQAQQSDSSEGKGTTKTTRKKADDEPVEGEVVDK